jgi:peptide/nickel transport system substrate-binding protein
MENKWFVRQLALAMALLAMALAAATVLALPDDSSLPPAPAAAVSQRDAGGQAAPTSPATVPYTTLVDVNIAEPSSLDPHWLYDTDSQRVAGQVYETLLMHEREDPAAWIPLLASGWVVAADSQVFTFTIRSGVTFHQGGTLEAHDVAYSFWRGLLQDRSSGPAWMLLWPLFGVYDVDNIAGDDLQKCQTVKDAITFDDGGRTVTFHLATPFAPFLDILATNLGMILDQEWVAASGGWGGSCADWRGFNDPPADGSVLYDQMDGTGPFQLEYWVPAEVKLTRYDGYWRHEPAWPEGPSGPATLQTVLMKTNTDWATRKDMLLNGEADTVYVATADAAELDPYLWGVYDGYLDQDPSLVDPVAGKLRLFKNLPVMAQTPLLFNCAINTDTNPFIGSGTLDGNGIPPDFFADLNVRKAFNYAMDWTRIISDVFNGEAARSRGPIPRGMLGYSEAQAVYPYSPTLSIAQFQQAWGGQVWTQGFSMTLAYIEGSSSQQLMAEILAQNIEALDTKFHVQAIGMPSTELLGEVFARHLPTFAGGFMEDFHHPHNWVQPYLHSEGSYAFFESLPAALAAQLDAKVDQCVQLTNQAAAQTCYEELQNMSYTNAAAMWGVQPLARRYVGTQVRGYFLNPAVAPPYYYAFSKGAPPAVAMVSGSGQTVDFGYAPGATATLELPAGAVGETSEILFTPDIVVEEDHPGGFRLGGMTFDLQVCPNGDCLGSYTFGETVSLTLHYRDADVAGLIESELYLYTWDGSDWVDVVTECGWPPSAYGRDLDGNLLVVPLCHATRFGLAGGTRNIYLPLTTRTY